jgi:hypothetical protein
MRSFRHAAGVGHAKESALVGNLTQDEGGAGEAANRIKPCLETNIYDISQIRNAPCEGRLA